MIEKLQGRTLAKYYIGEQMCVPNTNRWSERKSQPQENFAIFTLI